MRNGSRVLILIIVLILSVSLVAYAESVDFSKMSDDEIRALIAEANSELVRRNSETIDNETWYDLDGFSFCISNFYRYSESGKDYLAIAFDWKNTSDKPDDFSIKLRVEGYQNGIQLSDGFAWNFDSNTGSKIMPGYQTTSYRLLTLSDSSEVTLFIDDIWDWNDTFDDISTVIKPEQLEVFSK